jgi:hypothetical protein
MRRATGRLAVVALVALLTLASACVGNRPAAARPRADHNVITREELLSKYYSTAYDAVAALHSNWLQTKGPDSFVSPTQVWVYVDNTKVGGIETLRLLVPTSISYIRYFDGISASARWGLGHGQGVIFVSTAP